jgi:lysyl-tRNA synthetase class 2
MKQLLAKGSGSIYQICKAFRKDPVGLLHNTEFTILEWYRIGFSLEELMTDVVGMINQVFSKRPVQLVSYSQAFKQHLDIDPFSMSADDLASFAKNHVDIDGEAYSKDFWLDLLLTHFIEPNLGKDNYTFLTEYPASQAALAQTKKNAEGFVVAERFELYIEGVEIANGYLELTNPTSYRERFKADNLQRRSMGLPEVAIDEELLDDLLLGFPECSGVALGIDRLLAVLN